eukprot:1941995-Pyramimonas_sp.AAC.1
MRNSLGVVLFVLIVFMRCPVYLRVMLAGPEGESSGRKWGPGQGGEKRGRVSGVLRAPLPLLAQEDPALYGVWGVECILAVISTGGPIT